MWNHNIVGPIVLSCNDSMLCLCNRSFTDYWALGYLDKENKAGWNYSIIYKVNYFSACKLYLTSSYQISNTIYFQHRQFYWIV
jgi:hypothetical protein